MVMAVLIVAAIMIVIIAFVIVIIYVDEVMVNKIKEKYDRDDESYDATKRRSEKE